jgi:hypothetical protein
MKSEVFQCLRVVDQLSSSGDTMGQCVQHAAIDSSDMQPHKNKKTPYGLRVSWAGEEAEIIQHGKSGRTIDRNGFLFLFCLCNWCRMKWAFSQQEETRSDAC